MFEAVQRADRPSLRTFAKTFIKTGNDTAALLCLDHVFSSPPELHSLPFTEVQESLSSYFEYVCLLNMLRDDESLAEGSNCQRLFGFQVLRESRYLIPKYTLVHERLVGQSGSSGKSVDGYRCSYDELRRGIIQLISARIRDRTETQNYACRDARGFSPCLQLLIRRNCFPPCPFQHIQPEQSTADWYHARLRLILLQFKILSSADYLDRNVIKYVLNYSASDACRCSPNVKLLARGIIFSTSSTIPKAWVVRKP